MSKNLFFLVSVISMILFSLLVGASSKKQTRKPRVLVFSKTEGFRHSAISNGQKAIQKLAHEHNFVVDTTENATKFNKDSLKKYSAIVFLNTTGDVLNSRQQTAFKSYIQTGGGYVGIHSASDTEYDWSWYGKLVGAYFKGHPKVQSADLTIHQDDNFSLLDSLPDPWTRVDEWYNFRQPPKDVNVLIEIDEDSYNGGTMNDTHPMVWYHKYDGGRSFYMELGHTKDSYTDPNFLSVLWGGIKYAIGTTAYLNY